MLRLNEEQVTGKVDFIHEYLHAQNAADDSKMDANANVTQKNIATLEAELMKDFFVQVNRKQVSFLVTSWQKNTFVKLKTMKFTCMTKPALNLTVFRSLCTRSYVMA